MYYHFGDHWKEERKLASFASFAASIPPLPLAKDNTEQTS